MKEKVAGRSIKTKILGIVLVSILIITAILGYLSFELSKIRLVSMLGDSIKAVATSIAGFLKQEDIIVVLANIDRIREKYLASTSPAISHVYEKKLDAQIIGQGEASVNDAIYIYARYMEVLSNIKKNNKIDSPINVYVVDNNRLRIVLTSDPVLLTGATYIVNPSAAKALSSGLATSTGIYKDKDGTWISAYAPKLAQEALGRMIIVEVNYKIDAYLRKLNRELAIIIFACILGFICAIFISYELVEKLASAIRRLDGAARELEKGHYEMHIDVKSDDEIGHLARTFELLRVSIREKIEELKLSIIKEKRAHLESIVALTNAIEMRDPYTKEHLRRVEKYALLIAKEMHLSRDEVQKLQYTCFLHDIGKIYINTELLQKIKLSPEDSAEIRKHSERGAKIIEGIQFLKDVKDAVLYHQERFDGKGYPDGLKGKEIPLLARIVSVADAFDAMTTDRPYRKKMSFKEAMNEIDRKAGTQFDPDVCNAFLKYRDEIEEIAEKHFGPADAEKG